MTKINFILLLLLPLSACSITAQNSAAIDTYDLGLFKQNEPFNHSLTHNNIRLNVTDINPAPYLANQGINYRLTYHNPTRTYVYANSRWRAHPARLLTQHLRAQISNTTDYLVIKDNSSAKSDYILHLELDEFTQVFTAEKQSHVVLNMRASLVKRQTHTLIAQQTFHLQQDTPSADAAGAVHALAQSSQELTSQLILWLSNNLDN